MTAALPLPLVPADVDLRGHDWMPLYGERLFGSESWIEASDRGRVAMLRLWWQAFAKEKPAASLPDNDRLLAVYAGYGDVLTAWRKIKPEAMRGFVLCSDGRWYHKVVAEIAMEAWHRQQDRQETNAAKTERQRRWRERLKALTAALRAAGKTPPRGASLEALEKMAVDAGVDVSTQTVDAYKASAEIGNTEQDRTGHNRKEKDLPEAAASPAAARATPEDRDAEDRALVAWNDAAKQRGWPEAQFLNSTRRWALRQRLAECGGLDGWTIALERAAEAQFLRTSDGKPQRWFNLDWLLKPESFTRLMEGLYAERHGNRTGATSDDDIRTQLDALADWGRESSG